MATSKKQSQIKQQDKHLGISLAIYFVKAYQLLLSPFLGNNCRFYPSCSSYTIQALETHGFVKGTFLSLKRISKCHPWHPGGIDEVPEKTDACCKPNKSLS